VLVTGASTGLGLETALYLAEHGFKVYATTLSLQDRSAIEAPARKRNLNLRVLQLDITDHNSINSVVETIVAESGGIYGLVNNAGTRLRGCFEDLSDKEVRHLFNTNVFGTMAVTRAVLPYMRAARQGRIVMITSVAGKIGSFGVSAYCATKFAQEGFGESLAQEVAPLGIKVVLVEPGIIKTEAWSLHRVVAAGAKNPNSPYHTWFHQMEKLADKMVKSSSTDPLDVARIVHKALTISRPRLRYMVGRRAKLVFALRRYIPGECFERFYFRQIIRMVTKPADL
jgi:NAD(P)-dependent dehydrogenase (short-subunit alcohol dehydrogenase family)